MKVKRIRSLAVAGLLIAAMFAVIPNAAAYTVAPSGGPNNPCGGWGLNDIRAKTVVQLCFAKSEASSLFYWPGYAADVVLQVAKSKGMVVQRTKDSIATEIRGHAALMMAPNILIPRNGAWRWSYDVANPMDIEMNKEEPWVYLFD